MVLDFFLMVILYSIQLVIECGNLIKNICEQVIIN